MFAKKTTEQIKAATKSNNDAAAFYNNPTYRAWFYQILLAVLLLGFFITIVGNTLDNMAAQGIKSGFAFLNTSTSFDVLMSLIPYESTDNYKRLFVLGILNTILVSVIGIIFATIIGFFVGVAYFSPNILIKRLSIIYVETFRNIPVVLQVLFWYTAVLATLPSLKNSLSIGDSVFLNQRGLYVPKLVGQEGSNLIYLSIFAAIVIIFLLRKWAKRRQDLTGKQFPVLWTSLGLFFGLPLVVLFATGVPFTVDYPVLNRFNFSGGVSIIPELMALSIALSIYAGAFIAEAVRAGIQSVPKGQTEAARSIGLKESKIMSLIVVPQSLRVITPMLNSEYQSLVKNSTIATVIGYPELFTVFAGSALNQVGQAIEMMFMTLAIYFIINMLISFAMNQFGKSTQIAGR